MKPNPENPNDVLNRAITEIRNTAVDPAEVEGAAIRVLQNVQAEFEKVLPYPASAEVQMDRIRSCNDFTALIPAYLSASLTPSRKMLLEDHVHDCVACRKAMEKARSVSVAAQPPRAIPAATHRSVQRVKWMAAAVAAVLFIGVGLQTSVVRDLIWPIDVHATAETVEGGLFSISGQSVRAVRAGERIERLESVRTGTDSGAVIELADGSRVEMGPRAELSLDRARDGVKINLGRGNVIVSAAKQRTGHLYVVTMDCTVSVVGTVFSVSAAAKGSRVSVIEGEVHVLYGEVSEALKPGQQVSTSPVMAAIPVSQEIAWSRDLSKHLALLKEYVKFAEDIGKRIENTEMRFTSSLVPLIPENAVVVASLPNISQSFAESYALFRQRVSENELLQEWWSDRGDVDELVQRLVRVGAYLGPEVVLALSKEANEPVPLLLATAEMPDALVAALQDDIQRMASVQGADPEVRLVRSLADLQQLASSGATGMIVYVQPQEKGLVAVSPNIRQLQQAVAFSQQPTANPFSATVLFRRLEQAYVGGVGWLLAADLQRLVPPDDGASPQLGLANVEQLLVEQTTGSSGASYRATLGFSQARQGMASWLAGPSPMGGLEFISPNAYGVAGVVTKDPALIVDDLFSVLRQDAEAWQELDDFQREHRLDIRYDFAASLGNEFLVAVDGPILPTPSWKLVIEVNDAARLQNAIEWSITEMNREAAARQEAPVVLTSETAGGRTFYATTTSSFPTGIHYTFWGGYLIMAPSRALLMEAIQSHDTGNSLARSSAFRSQLPADGNDYTSGFVYQNIQAIANALPAEVVQGTSIGTGIGTLPTLISLYGEPDRIVMTSKGVLGMNIASLVGIEGMIRASGVR